MFLVVIQLIGFSKQRGRGDRFQQTSIPAKREGDSNCVDNFLANRQHEIAIYSCTSREMHFNKIENELKLTN